MLWRLPLESPLLAHRARREMGHPHTGGRSVVSHRYNSRSLRIAGQARRLSLREGFRFIIPRSSQFPLLKEA
jgi:hypothetical protein